MSEQDNPNVTEQQLLRVFVRPGGEVRDTDDANAADTQSEPSVRVNADAGSVYSVSGDDVTVKGPVAVSSRVEFPSSSGILATAHTVNGRPIPPHAIDDKTLVYVSDAAGNRSETEVGTLVNAGVLTRSSDGRGYVEGQQQQQAEEQQPSGPTQFPTKEAEELYQHLANSLPETTFNQLLVRVMAGKVDDAYAHDVGAQLGTDAKGIRSAANTITNAFAVMARDTMQKAGVSPTDLEDAYAWGWENQADQMRDANLKLVMTRDPSSFAVLAEAYLRANPPSQEAVERAGLKTYVGADGKTLMIRVDGMEMPVAVAARNGWL